MAVYFVRAGDYVKIGLAKDPEKRLVDLQVSNAEYLDLVHIIPGGRELESYYHEAFKHHHVRGEWFEYEPVMAELPYIELGIARPKELNPEKAGEGKRLKRYALRVPLTDYIWERLEKEARRQLLTVEQLARLILFSGLESLNGK